MNTEGYTAINIASYHILEKRCDLNTIFFLSTVNTPTATRKICIPHFTKASPDRIDKKHRSLIRNNSCQKTIYSRSSREELANECQVGCSNFTMTGKNPKYWMDDKMFLFYPEWNEAIKLISLDDFRVMSAEKESILWLPVIVLYKTQEEDPIP